MGKKKRKHLIGADLEAKIKEMDLPDHVLSGIRTGKMRLYPNGDVKWAINGTYVKGVKAAGVTATNGIVPASKRRTLFSEAMALRFHELVSPEWDDIVNQLIDDCFDDDPKIRGASREQLFKYVIPPIEQRMRLDKELPQEQYEHVLLSQVKDSEGLEELWTVQELLEILPPDVRENVYKNGAKAGLTGGKPPYLVFNDEVRSEIVGYIVHEAMKADGLLEDEEEEEVVEVVEVRQESKPQTFTPPADYSTVAEEQEEQVQKSKLSDEEKDRLQKLRKRRILSRLNKGNPQ